MNTLSLVLGFLACSTLTGFVLQNRTLFTVGQSIGFAPMPLPFREFSDGSENIAVKISATVSNQDQTWNVSGKQFREYFSLTHRPHRAAIPFYTLSSYFAVIPHNIKSAAFVYICKQQGGHQMVIQVAYAHRTYTYPIVCIE